MQIDQIYENALLNASKARVAVVTATSGGKFGREEIDDEQCERYFFGRTGSNDALRV